MNDLERRILALAKGMGKGDGPMTRADLAYELRDAGVGRDSPDLARLVWQVYLASGRDEKVRRAFVANSGARPLVDVYRASSELDEGDGAGALAVIAAEAKKGRRALESLEEDVEAALSRELTESVSGLVAVLVGTGGVEKAKKTAGAVFEKYARLVAGYDRAREGVQGVAADFVALRGAVERVHRRYALALVDIFGDSVKAVAPEMFDYDSIQWLDAQAMLGKAQLQYTTVSTRCSALLGEIADDFRKRLAEASGVFRASGGSEAGLILAGLSMISHYADAATKSAEAQAAAMRLQSDIRRDATAIKGDMLRLAKVFKTINDLHIPRARVFYKHAEDILGAELEALVSAFYATPEAKALRARREELLREREALGRSIHAEEADIAHYGARVRECRELLAGMKGQYEAAKSGKPSRPGFLANALTFGGARRGYDRRLYGWNQVCGPVVEQYDSLREDVEMDGAEMASLRKAMKEESARLAKLGRELDAVNGKLREAVRDDPAAKAGLLARLEDLVALLRVSRGVLESGLDKGDAVAVKVADRGALQLPEDIGRNLALFREGLLAARKAGGAEGGEVCPAAGKAGDEAVGRLSGLFDAWLNLEALRAAENGDRHEYERDLARLQERFRDQLDEIDDRASALYEAMRRINTAATPEQRKRGLMLLADVGEQWGDGDWERFLAGDKTLSI